MRTFPSGRGALRGRRARILGIALTLVLGAAALALIPASEAEDSYWRPTNENDCPTGLVCATRDLKNACCIEPELLWTIYGPSCPSTFRHIHSFSEQI